MRPAKLTLTAACLCLLFFGGLLAAADEAEATVATYYLFATGGVSIPGDGVTDLSPGAEADPGRRLLLQRTAQEGQSVITWEPSGRAAAFREFARAVGSGPFERDTLIAAGARANLVVDGRWEAWRVGLYDYDAADGSWTLIGQGRSPAGDGRQSLSIELTNETYAVPAGHRLGLVVEAAPAPVWTAGDVSLVVGGGEGLDTSRLVVDEAAGEDLTPRTTVFTTPARPDGTGDWFRTVPEITLVADSPAGSQTTIFYAWDDGAAGVYAGRFTPPPGRHSLRFWAEDRHGHREPTRTQEFAVDAVLDPPTLLVPGLGSSEELLGVSGVVPIEVSAADAVSGLVEVGIYRFPMDDGEVTVPGGLLITGPTAPLSSGEGYRLHWTSATTNDGEYLVQAQARDAAGNLTWSPGRAVRVDNSPPVVQITAPQASASVVLPYAVLGSVDDASTFNWAVEVREAGEQDWTSVGTGAGPRDGVLAFLDPEMGPVSGDRGLFDLRVVAADALGNRVETEPLRFGAGIGPR